MERRIDVRLARTGDIDSWMELIGKVRHIFPGFETDEQIADYRKTVRKKISDSHAICAMDGDRVCGFILFSVKDNMLCHMAVDPDYRRMGIASRMVEMMIANLDRTRDISVITFREDDEKGKAPRALYKSFGFEEGELCFKYGYPEQRLILRAE